MSIATARKTLVIAAVLGFIGTFGLGEASAQAQNGRGVGKNQVSLSYYKTPPGKQDEWLALYKQYHKPIVQYGVDHGNTISSTIYAAGNHSPGQPWDIAIISISDPTKQPADISRAELIKKLYPNLKDYVRAEKERWSLTIDHWDERLVELDPNEEPFSVYLPLTTTPRK
ncbi:MULTISPECIES: hypothetical protein [unclassified Lysobacter]